MKLVQIGTVDVDAGLVMIGDPCYTLPDHASRRSDVAKNWARFCEATGDTRCSQPFGLGAGIVLRTLYGDGEYPVMAEMTKRGAIRRVIVDFDPEGDDQEEHCDDYWDDYED